MLRLGKRALQDHPGLLQRQREKGTGTDAAMNRMGPKIRHPERYDDHGHLKSEVPIQTTAPAPAATKLTAPATAEQATKPRAKTTKRKRKQTRRTKAVATAEG
jgi:hypothetical protein